VVGDAVVRIAADSAAQAIGGLVVEAVDDGDADPALRGVRGVRLRLMLRRARRAAVAGRPVVLAVSVASPVGGGTARRWRTGALRIDGTGVAWRPGRTRRTPWTPAPGLTRFHGPATARRVVGPRGWPVVSLSVPGEPPQLVSAPPPVFRVLVRLMELDVSGVDLGPGDRSGPPRHRQPRPARSGRRRGTDDAGTGPQFRD